MTIFDWKTFWVSPLWDYFDKIGIAAALIAMLFSILIWLNQRRKERQDNALLDICLYCPETDQSISLPAQIRRKNLSRAEIQGLLGILPLKQNRNGRYFLSALNSPAFFDLLERVQIDSQLNELVIECKAEELDQFIIDVS